MIDRNQVVALLRAQADDLSRFRLLIEAQFAVLMMEDSALLDPLGREADNLVAEIVRRDAELARWAGAPGELPIPASLQAEVTAASERAGLAVLRLAARMRSLHLEQARELTAVEVEWNRLASGVCGSTGTPTGPGADRPDRLTLKVPKGPPILQMPPTARLRPPAGPGGAWGTDPCRP